MNKKIKILLAVAGVLVILVIALAVAPLFLGKPWMKILVELKML